MKLWLKLSSIIILILLIIFATFEGMNFLNMSSDIGVIIGIGIFLLILLVFILTCEFIVKRIKQIIGRIRIDPTIMQALNAKLATTQNAMTAENRLREAQANAANRVAAAEGEARANLALAKSITPELIEWRKLDLTQNAINRWNGVRPMVEGNSSGMLLQLPVGK